MSLVKGWHFVLPATAKPLQESFKISIFLMGTNFIPPSKPATEEFAKPLLQIRRWRSIQLLAQTGE